jgi:N4-gp56 family major capsid protein
MYIELLATNLKMFDVPGPVQTTLLNTPGNDLSPEMKTYYDMYLIDNAKPKLVHDQFGQKKPIPKGKGKTIEFRKYSPLPKALTPLVEGVTPQGSSLNVTTITATVKQYGDYITISDMLDLTAIDDNLVQATELLGDQSGETIDTIVRDIINGGTNVLYGQGGTKTARYLLTGGEATGNDYFGVENVRLAVRILKNGKAKPISGNDFVAIIHPDISYHLTKDSEWQNVKQYDPKDWYAGEIGRIHGVRFVETTEAKVFHAENLLGDTRNLSVAATLQSAGKTVTLKEAVTAAQATALKGRKVIIGAALHEITNATATDGATAATIVTKENVTTTDGVKDAVIYPGEAGAKGRDVYSVLFLGKNAYGSTEVEGGGLQNIVKQLGSAGTGDPLNQRATSGWKATKTAEILTPEFMLRNEVCAAFEAGAN